MPYYPPAGGGSGVTNDAPAGSIAVSDGTDITGSADLTWDAIGRVLGITATENQDASIEVIGLGSQLHIRAGAGDASHVGGEISIRSGQSNGESGGTLTLSTGSDSGGGDSGELVIETGEATDGSVGSISIRTGASANTNDNGGDINIVAATGQVGSGGSIIIQAGAKVTGGSHGSVQIYSGDGNTSIEAGNAGLYILGVVLFDSLPSTDPEVAGQLYTDGAPAPGVPQALMVSGGPA